MNNALSYNVASKWNKGSTQGLFARSLSICSVSFKKFWYKIPKTLLLSFALCRKFNKTMSVLQFKCPN